MVKKVIQLSIFSDYFHDELLQDVDYIVPCAIWYFLVAYRFYHIVTCAVDPVLLIYPLFSLSPFSNHKFVFLCLWESVSALYIDSFVLF